MCPDEIVDDNPEREIRCQRDTRDKTKGKHIFISRLAKLLRQTEADPPPFPGEDGRSTSSTDTKRAEDTKRTESMVTRTDRKLRGGEPRERQAEKSSVTWPRVEARELGGRDASEKP
jgi:hypothetical protein